MGPKPWEHSRRGRVTRENTESLKSSRLFLPPLLVVVSISLTVVVHPPLLHSFLACKILVSVCRDDLNTLTVVEFHRHRTSSPLVSILLHFHGGVPRLDIDATRQQSSSTRTHDGCAFQSPTHSTPSPAPLVTPHTSAAPHPLSAEPGARACGA